MKFCDVFKLVSHEYKYEKLEWIASVILQMFIYTSVLFLLTIAGNIDGICGKYLAPIYEDGYNFRLVGYTEADISTLEEMGFRDITFSNSTNEGTAYIDELDGIWFYKIKAVIEGKDIWNADLDETLGVVFFCQVIVGSLGIVMLVIMLNNISNAIAMKLIRRKNYIQMLGQLGCARKISQRIFYLVFVIRNVCALIVAILLNSYLIKVVNTYMIEEMYIPVGFERFNGLLVGGSLLISVGIMRISFIKQWRQCNEC